MTLPTVTTRPSRRAQHRVARGLVLLPTLMLCGAVVVAAGYVCYVLWPRWPGPVTGNTPALPIMVGEVTFNIQPGAIRVPVQRKPGVQDRVDLSYLWPSLDPPESTGSSLQPVVVDGDLKLIDRLFVTLTNSSGTLAPVERLRTIYARYIAREPKPTAVGLMAFSFREETPYRGEDLIYDASNPERFFVRCTHEASGRVPGTCLAERRMRNADMIVRFPRAWLRDWPAVAVGIERLIGNLKPH